MSCSSGSEHKYLRGERGGGNSAGRRPEGEATARTCAEGRPVPAGTHGEGDCQELGWG